jgi:hypothetical protein
VARDFGTKVTLSIGEPQDGLTSGRLYAIDLGTTGVANAYRTAIATCGDTMVHFMDRLQPLSGNLSGFTVQGVADLINLDPDAVWDPGSSKVIKSCAPLTCGPVSPRIVAIPVFDPARFEASLIYAGQPELAVTNFIFVFIDGVVGGKVTGYVTTLQP